MADSRYTRNEYHPYRCEPGHVLRIMTGTAWHQPGAQAEFFCGLEDRLTHTRIGWSGNVYVDFFEVELRFTCPSNLLSFGIDPFVEHLNLRRVEISQFKTQNDLAGNHIRCSGQCLDSSHSPNLPSGNTGDNAIHSFDKFSCRKERVLATIHRSSARVIGKAFDGYVPPVYSHNSFDHTDVDLPSFKNPTLLDMEFEISGDLTALAPDARQLSRISADKADSFANSL